jgi:hypothetical protein
MHVNDTMAPSLANHEAQVIPLVTSHTAVLVAGPIPGAAVAVATAVARPDALLTEEVVMTRASEELEEREMIMPLLAIMKSVLATL